MGKTCIFIQTPGSRGHSHWKHSYYVSCSRKALDRRRADVPRRVRRDSLTLRPATVQTKKSFALASSVLSLRVVTGSRRKADHGAFCAKEHAASALVHAVHWHLPRSKERVTSFAPLKVRIEKLHAPKSSIFLQFILHMVTPAHADVMPP